MFSSLPDFTQRGMMVNPQSCLSSVVGQPIRVKKVQIRLHCYLLGYSGRCQCDEANAIQDSCLPASSLFGPSA